MRTMLRGRRLLLATVLAVALLAAIPLVAYALTTLRAGGVSVQTVVATNDAATAVTGSTAWTDVPGAALSVQVPANHRGLVTTTFNAESACYGASGYCSTRTVLVRPDGTLLELDPAGGVNFAFDSTDSGREGSASWEAHSADRNTLLPAGSWRLKVQRRVTGAGITFWLDEISFKAEVAQIP
jgi:hypothetical protein